jgi:hypothetical protein
MRVYLTSFPVLAGLAAIAGGCAGGGGSYPSLAMRPVESGVVTAPAPSPPAPIRPALAPGWLEDQRTAAKALHAAFIAQEAQAERLAGAAVGQPIDNTRRGAAMVALADLDAQRGQTASVLAAVDGAAVEAATALAADPALAAVQSEIAAMLARQDAGIARVRSVLGR